MNELIGPPPPEPVKKVRADALDRANRAWSARVAGGSWREAAELAGFSTAEHAMDAVRSAFGGVPKIDREALRHLWRERLERSWRQVVLDMADRVPGSVTASVRVAAAAATLDGLNEPVRVNVEADALIGMFTKELQDAGFME
jgi:hypothetical protein